MGYKAGFIFENQKEMTFNACVFATIEEADIAGEELMSRWFLPINFDIVEVEEEANYTIVDGRPVSMDRMVTN